MLNNVSTNVEHIIAKLDNDFNVDNSDWIPRIGTWVIEAMSQLNVLRKVRKKVKLIVHDRIAYSNCPINSPNLIVTDCNGCKINKSKSNASCNDCSSTGEKSIAITPNTVDMMYNGNIGEVPDYTLAETINGCNRPPRYNIYNYNYTNSKPNTYFIIDDNKLELDFVPSSGFIYVETEVVETEYSNTYDCDLPVIPNVGLLIEAIGYYCLYKMLCRGYKHPVFNLAASQYGTNPHYEWKNLKDEAKRAVTIDAQGDINVTDNNILQSAFFITMFK